MVAPHQSIKVGGKEVSGTVMRDLLGSPKIDDKERPKLFKQFGYYDKGIFNMMNNKFKKLYEVFEQFLVEHNIEKILESNSLTSQLMIFHQHFMMGFVIIKNNLSCG